MSFVGTEISGSGFKFSEMVRGASVCATAAAASNPAVNAQPNVFANFISSRQYQHRSVQLVVRRFYFDGLTLPTHPRKKQRVPPRNFYTEWRARHLRPTALRERDAVPPEKLLQAVWQHQRLRRDSLKTSDGRALRILHPGFKNLEAGPDFRGAVIQLSDEPPRSGDVEIDLQTSGWRAHGHDKNPNFKNVILHVVWEGEPNLPATLTLQKLLDAPLAELDLWLGGESAESLPENLRGRCCAPLRELPPEGVTELLNQAALGRLQGKAARFQARAKASGWEQSLWEGLFRALGYKQNTLIAQNTQG
jgi:hypothetical protein